MYGLTVSFTRKN